MRFLVDECTGPSVAKWLRESGYDVFSVYEESRGIDDSTVIRKAWREHRILITNDKDFGEKVHREHIPHRGIILLRLSDERSSNKIQVLQKLLTHYSDYLEGQFIVATESHVRFSRATSR